MLPDPGCDCSAWHRGWNRADLNIERMTTGTSKEGCQGEGSEVGVGRAGQRMPGGDPARASVVHSRKRSGTDGWAVEAATDGRLLAR